MPTVIYGAEAWWLKEREKRRLNLFGIKCSRKMRSVKVMDSIRNGVIRQEVGVMRDLAGRAENCVLMWVVTWNVWVVKG